MKKLILLFVGLAGLLYSVDSKSQVTACCLDFVVDADNGEAIDHKAVSRNYDWYEEDCFSECASNVLN